MTAIQPSRELLALCERAANELQEFTDSYRCQSCAKDSDKKCAYCEAEIAATRALVLEIRDKLRPGDEESAGK